MKKIIDQKPNKNKKNKKKKRKASSSIARGSREREKIHSVLEGGKHQTEVIARRTRGAARRPIPPAVCFRAPTASGIIANSRNSLPSVEGWFRGLARGQEEGVERLSFLTARSKHPGAIETHGHLLHFNNGFPSSPPPFSPPPPPRYHHPELRTWNTGERATLPAHSRFTVSFMERNGGRSNQGLTISSMDECIIRPNLPLPLPNAATCRRGRRFTLPGKIV